MGFFELVKRQDLFAIPVQLTYKGERGFSSFLGGCCSIIFVLTVMALFGYYSHSFYKNPHFTSSASVSYITYDDETQPHYLQTNRTTFALYPDSYYNHELEDSLRVRFYSYQEDDSGGDWTPIQAVYCRDFFADEIKAEAK